MSTKTHHKQAFGSDAVLSAEIENLCCILSADMTLNKLTLIVNGVIRCGHSKVGILFLDSCLLEEVGAVYSRIDRLAALFEILTVPLFVLIPLLLFAYLLKLLLNILLIGLKRCGKLLTCHKSLINSHKVHKEDN